MGHELTSGSLSYCSIKKEKNNLNLELIHKYENCVYIYIFWNVDKCSLDGAKQE